MKSVIALSALGAALAASPADLARAHQKIPGHAFLGDDISSMNKALNQHLTTKFGDIADDCEQFTSRDLHTLQKRLFASADPALLKVYDHVDAGLPTQGRRRTEESLEQLDATWEATEKLAAESPELRAVYRDALCHQTVMWFIHHVSEDTRAELAKEGVRLPLLPQNVHQAPEDPSPAQYAVHKVYDSHTTCQACHVGGIPNQGTMAPPLTPDPNHPGWDRIRRCDAACTGTPEEGCVQYDPPCGPCDGTGGPYYGDALADFTPVTCKVVGTPDQVPETDRVAPLLPKQFKVELQGTDRLVRVQNPTNGTLYSNIHGVMYVDEDRADGNLALRHDTYYERFAKAGHGHAVEIHIQTPNMMKTNITGPMFSTIEALKPFEPFPNFGYCTCVADPVGVPHWDAFKDAQYMGRIKLDPIEYLNRTVTVDHYAKWFFHIFMDADKSSPTYGQVMRFYSPYAGFAVYHNWQMVPPESVYPNVWNDTLPEAGPSKCMNPQKVPDICDHYYPSDTTGSFKSAPTMKEQIESLARHPLFPSAFERIAHLSGF